MGSSTCVAIVTSPGKSRVDTTQYITPLDAFGLSPLNIEFQRVCGAVFMTIMELLCTG